MNDLVAIQSVVPADVFVAGGGDPIIDAIKREVLAVDRDISTEEGRETVRKLAYKVARSKTFIDEAGKKFVADKKQEIKVVDNERSRIWEALEKLQKDVRQPLTDFEDKEEHRVAGHESALLELEQATIFDGFTPSSEQVKARLDIVAAHEARNWEEFAERGKKTSSKVKEQLSQLHAERLKHELDQIELERLRKEAEDRQRIEREERLKAEAAEKARLEAETRARAEAQAVELAARQAQEAIERAKREAEERAAKAEQDRLEAESLRVAQEERAKKEAAELAAKVERDRVEAEQRARLEQETAVRKERERIEAKERAEKLAAEQREADLRHRGSINRSALEALMSAGIPEEHAKTAIEAIARRQIPNVHISY
jgi:hypothetical protein